MSPLLVGRWIEDHGVVHNMMYNATTNQKIPHKIAMQRSEWWDNGVLPLWITAQNQVACFTLTLTLTLTLALTLTLPLTLILAPVDHHPEPGSLLL